MNLISTQYANSEDVLQILKFFRYVNINISAVTKNCVLGNCN